MERVIFMNDLQHYDHTLLEECPEVFKLQGNCKVKEWKI